ncbi:MAG TPA: hypothetical protein VF160_03005 [Candidatus Dormibacteraeota bacterium]
MAALMAVANPSPAALVCDPQTPSELAAQADVVFTGKVTALVQDHDVEQTPPAILNPVLRYWPKQVPLPRVPKPAPGPGTPAARFQVATAYKGAVGTEITVRLLGDERRFRPGETWTVFADRSNGHLFTTECSGDQPAPIEGRAYGLTAHRPTSPASADSPPAQLYWVLGILLALGAAASGTLLVANRRRRPAAADFESG